MLTYEGARFVAHFGVVTSFASGHSIAGGLMLYEIATDNTGLANAGAAARPQGPSTIASNSAGLNYLSGSQITAGPQMLFGDLSFERDSDTITPGSRSTPYQRSTVK